MNLPSNQGNEAPAPARGTEEQRPLQAKVAVGLALLTFLIFLPVVEYEFINYDDDIFVTNNPKVAPGFTWEGVKWAFTSADIDYWRPLSWLSHMLDIELAGSVAGFHHLSSVGLHIAATVLCFLAFCRLTGQMWPSALVAGLFAWHPLHVESVAWVAERKDVLCGMFWFYTIWAYAGYVRAPSPRRYLLTFAGFVLAVMSKPMVVTLPCVLLLLDVWPLRRVALPAPAEWHWTGWWRFARVWWPLVKEKLPLFGVVAVLAFSTIYSQHRVGTMSSFDALPLDIRIKGALYGYGMYLTQTFLPMNLCVLYPYLGFGITTANWLGAGAFMVTASSIACWQAHRHPLLFTGWFWFVGVLVPVIGLIQVGEQAHADRYTYLPLTGLLLILCWGGWRLTELGRLSRRGAAVAAVLVLAACAAGTRRQLPYWATSATVFERAIAVTERNPSALNNYSAYLLTHGRAGEVIPVLQEAYRLHPTQVPLFNLGYAYALINRPVESLQITHEAFRMDPKSKYASEQIATVEEELKRFPEDAFRRRILAAAYALRNNYPKAVEYLREASRLAPDDLDISVDLAAYLTTDGKETEAERILRDLLRHSPAHRIANSSLGTLLSKQGRLTDALPHLEAAVLAEPEDADTRHNYALLLAKLGRSGDALREFRAVLKRSPVHRPAIQQIAWLMATREDVRDAQRAALLAADLLQTTRKPSVALLDTAAAAAAAAGDWATAQDNIRKALAAPKLADATRQRLTERQALYAARQPYTGTNTVPGF